MMITAITSTLIWHRVEAERFGPRVAACRANFAITAERFISTLARHGLTLRTATVEDVREPITEIATGTAASTRQSLNDTDN